MINEPAYNRKKFEDWIIEAVQEIPLYCDEWTNFNPSDPGITTLENLTALQIIQENYIKQLPTSLREDMLRITGFKSEAGKCAKVLLSPSEIESDILLPANQRFYVGDVPFEITKEVNIKNNRLIYAFSKHKDEIIELDNILSTEFPISQKMFGDVPQKEDALYLLMESEPDRERDMILYFKLDDSRRKNVSNDSIFSKTEWQCYTEKGFVTFTAKDLTGGFTHSGEVRLKWKGIKPAYYEEGEHRGYCIRCVLKEADYDIAPSVFNVYGFLFEAWQKQSQSLCYTFPQKDDISVHCNLFEEGYIWVFCKEEGENFYRRYKEAGSYDIKGRFFTIEKTGFGSLIFRFDKERFGHAPGMFPDAVKIVTYSEMVMKSYDLGIVYGYDDQEIQLPLKRVMNDNFTLMARRLDENGDFRYDFIKPMRTGEEELGYRLDETNGKIIIYNAGEYLDARLFVAGLATNIGSAGNVLENNEFIPEKIDGVKFINPGRAYGGTDRESFQDVKNRFLQDIEKPYIAVKASDYEQLVRDIPDICIDKVKASVDYVHNTVNLCVRPDIEYRFSKLSPQYINRINEYIDKRRLLGTVINIRQPEYVPVTVQATIFVKKQFKNCKETVESLLRERLDYINSDVEFGATLSYDDIYNSVEKLECVSYIRDFSMYTSKANLVKMKENDIRPQEHVLLYPGDFYIEYIIDIET